MIRLKLNIVILFLTAMSYYGCDNQDNLASLKDQVYIKLFGGSGSEEGHDFIQLNDGNFVIVGSTTSYSENEAEKDVFIVEADHNGNQLWTRRYGDQYDNIAHSVILSPDNNSLVIAGETYLSNGKRDILLLKTDLNGNKINEVTYGQVDLDEYGSSVINANSDGFLVVGTTNYTDSSFFYLLEVDDNLNEKPNRNRPKVGQRNLFNRSVSAKGLNANSYLCFGSSVDGGTNTGGISVPVGSSNFYLFTIPESGGTGVGGAQFFGSQLQEVATTFAKVTGGYLLAGYQINGNRSVPYIVKVNNNLDYQWERVIDPDNTGVTSREPTSIIQTNDGGILLLMKSLAQPYGTEIGLMKLNFTGDEVEWETSFGSDNNDVTGSVMQLTNDYFVMCGSIGFGEVNNEQINKMGLIKTNPVGELKPLE